MEVALDYGKDAADCLVSGDHMGCNQEEIAKSCSNAVVLKLYSAKCYFSKERWITVTFVALSNQEIVASWFRSFEKYCSIECNLNRNSDRNWIKLYA